METLEVIVTNTSPSTNFHKYIAKPESGDYLITVYLGKSAYKGKDLPKQLKVTISNA